MMPLVTPSPQNTFPLHYYYYHYHYHQNQKLSPKFSISRKATTMRNQLLSPFILFLVFFTYFSPSLAQAPAPAPPVLAPPAPPAVNASNITAILEKGGQFTTLIRLLKSTQEDSQINTQLKSNNQGLTVFAPTDNAFANLKAGTLNSLSDQGKVQLVQFHVLPGFISMSQFQTVSNPLRTQAGNSANGEFPLNVTTSGNQVNITTGVNTATVSNTLFTDGQLAVYPVDQVLLPLDLFGSSAAPAPAPSVAEKDVPAKSPAKSSGSDASVDASGSGASVTTTAVSYGLVFIAAIALKL